MQTSGCVCGWVDWAGPENGWLESFWCSGGLVALCLHIIAVGLHSTVGHRSHSRRWQGGGWPSVCHGLGTLGFSGLGLGLEWLLCRDPNFCVGPSDEWHLAGHIHCIVVEGIDGFIVGSLVS